MSSQSIWTITICKFKGISYYAHMSLVLILIWFGYESYTLSGELLPAIISPSILIATIALYELSKLALLSYTNLPTNNIVVYPFGGLSHNDRSLDLNSSQSGEDHFKILYLGFVIPLLLALFSITLLLLRAVATDTPTVDATFIDPPSVVLLFSSLLLLPVTPFPGGRLLRYYCQEHHRNLSFCTIVKFIALFLLLVLTWWIDSIEFSIASIVYLGISIEQFLFERTQKVADRFSAKDAMIPLDGLIYFSVTTHCADALDQALRSFQNLFPIFRHGKPVGYIEKNSLLQVTEDSLSPPVSDFMCEVISSVSPDTPLTLVLSIFRETEGPLVSVVDTDETCMGFLAKDKVLEFLVIKGVENHVDVSQGES